MSIINVNNLCFYRKHKNIFNNISLNIEKEKITAIMGPSGCGKTTLLKLICRQIKQDTGTITINGKNTSLLKTKELYNMRKDIGVLFQSGTLFTDLNVYENVAFPIREHTNLSEELIKYLVLMKLQSVGLRWTINLMPSELSIGMAKRVALARTIALDPSIIMYDEPFSGQDPISMGILLKLIKLLNKSLKITTVIVSHDVFETMNIADYVYIINNCKIVAQGHPKIITNINDKFIKEFINNDINYKYHLQYNKKQYEHDLFN